MRLRKVKMSGFKSFVDPTTMVFPSDMVGVVGPNGCGKSNIVDAIRWVMGASTKNIRGDNIEDVIFKGSSGRQPVGQASVELVFDNTVNKIGGKYAAYNEISIRRQIARDGQSKYYLNGSHCRRRDVVEIFLGTGLGPRSYAIIEQGMISRLIDAKPEEMRVYIEEAAGISKYKERRRETENRITHTRENLDRLQDLIDEVAKQITKLKRQATIAEKYKELKSAERTAQAELLLLRWQNVGAQLEQEQTNVEQKETQLEETVAKLRAIEAEIEQLRVDQTTANETMNKVQGEYYQIGADISRIEQTIQHAKETQLRQENELHQASDQLAQIDEESVKQKSLQQEYAEQIEILQTQLDELTEEFVVVGDAVLNAEKAEQSWREAWDELNIEISEPTHQVEVQTQRIEFLSEEVTRLEQRRDKFSEEHAEWVQQEKNDDLIPLEAAMSQHQQSVETSKLALAQTATDISAARERIETHVQQLDQSRSEYQQIQTELLTMQALQDAAMQSKQEEVNQWLNDNNLTDAARLADMLEVEQGWEGAVETVLEGSLQAICATDLQHIGDQLAQLQGGKVVILDASKDNNQQSSDRSLASKVKGGIAFLDDLKNILVADSLTQAFQMQEQLQPHQSVITKDGIWLSTNWLRYSKEVDTQAGVLSRKAAMVDLDKQLNELDEVIQSLVDQQKAAHQQLTQLEQHRDESQQAYQRAFHAHAESKAEIERSRSAIQHWQQRDSQLKNLIEESVIQLDTYRVQKNEATEKLTAARANLEILQARKNSLREKKEEVLNEFHNRKEQSSQLTENRHAIQLELESSRTRLVTAEASVERLNMQREELATRQEELKLKVTESSDPMAEMAEKLQDTLEVQLKVEQQLTGARNALDEVDNGIRAKEQQRLSVDSQINTERESLNQQRMHWQELNVRVQTIKEELDKYDASIEELTENMSDDASLQEWEKMVAELTGKISRLGAINLAAIEEHEEQSKRKEYLDSQNEDLVKALDTLESAIRKIDKETKERFKETFDLVNSHIQSMYPRLFPGGKAYLEMSGDDLLTTGVRIMARPPGKKVSSIQLLSGGEKALTAVALVLAIFELNPAPFCLLDEVDAPLDDANVGRFCDLIKEMSSRVQFAFITHNKTTMSYADHLLGVTMNEPGVSKLVSVDIEAAAELVNAG